MGTIMFRVKQSGTEFLGGTEVPAVCPHPEVKLILNTSQPVQSEDTVDLDIYMVDTAKLGAVRVFLRGNESVEDAGPENVLPAGIAELAGARALKGIRAITNLLALPRYCTIPC